MTMTDLDELFHHHNMRTIALARSMLAVLSVRELRVLHKHYYGRVSYAEELNKSCLLDELADRYAEDKLDAAS